MFLIRLQHPVHVLFTCFLSSGYSIRSTCYSHVSYHQVTASGSRVIHMFLIIRLQHPVHVLFTCFLSSGYSIRSTCTDADDDWSTEDVEDRLRVWMASITTVRRDGPLQVKTKKSGLVWKMEYRWRNESTSGNFFNYLVWKK
jgi:hypothetical protein